MTVTVTSERPGRFHISADDNERSATIVLRDCPSDRPESCEASLSNGLRFAGEMPLGWAERRAALFVMWGDT